MRHLHVVLSLVSGSLTAVALAACDLSVTGPDTASNARVVITQHDGAQPALFIGNIDGSDRARIHFVQIADPIPGNLPGFIPADTNLIALGSPSIAPTGGRIAVVATLAYDQSEIVVMKPDGTGEVASINTQIIASDPEWSPDGKKLAYVMSTLPNFRGLDLFVTDLDAHTVTRMTTNANIGNASIAWSPDGSTIYYSRTTQTSATGPSNWLSEVVSVNASTKVSQVVASGIVGQISAVARTGNRVLLTRTVVQAGDTTRVLVEAALGADPVERVLVASVTSDVAYAHYLSGTESYAVVVVATNAGGTVTDQFLLFNLNSNTVVPVANVPTGSGSANVDATLSHLALQAKLTPKLLK